MAKASIILLHLIMVAEVIVSSMDVGIVSAIGVSLLPLVDS